MDDTPIVPLIDLMRWVLGVVGTFAAILLVISFVVIGILALVLRRERKAREKYIAEHEKAQKELKEDLEAKIQALEEAINKASCCDDFEKLRKNNEATWVGFKKWADETIEGLRIRYENYTNHIEQLIESVEKSRSDIGNGVRQLVRVLAAALRGEKAFLDTVRRLGLRDRKKQPSEGKPPAGSLPVSAETPPASPPTPSSLPTAPPPE